MPALDAPRPAILWDSVKLPTGGNPRSEMSPVGNLTDNFNTTISSVLSNPIDSIARCGDMIY
jgi:hypothetical protein